MKGQKNKNNLSCHILHRKGFTLIELLVVIAIIALLASVLIVNMNSSRIKARDARRLADISQLNKQLEVCYGEKSDYPTPNGSWGWDATSTSGGWQHVYSCSTCYGQFKDAIHNCVVHPLMDPINKDPWAYYYFHFNTNATSYFGRAISPACKGRYVLMTHLELPQNENHICFDEPDKYEFFQILGY